MAAFAQFGSDLDAATQKLLNRGARLTELLKQPQYAPLQVEEQVVVIYAGVNGYLDNLPVGDVGRYEEELLRHFRDEKKEVLETIRNEKKLSDETTEKVKSTIEAFTNNFASSSSD
jgi:F-type H+-transporting ATPase subunit alpha